MSQSAQDDLFLELIKAIDDLLLVTTTHMNGECRRLWREETGEKVKKANEVLKQARRVANV